MKTLLSIVCMLSAGICMSQDDVISLWAGSPPNAKESKLKEIRKNTPTLSLKNVIDPTLEVYLPSKFNANGMAIMICPGGGYGGLAYAKEGTDIAKWLNGYGIAAFVLKYRLPDDESNEVPYLSPIMDAKRGMELIRSGAEKWGINPTKVGAMGFSAGGHLVSTLGTQFEASNRPDFMALIYPVVTMNEEYTHNGSRKNLLGELPTQKLINDFSNELHITKNSPPTFILHSQDDNSVPVENSIRLFLALKENHVPAEMHIYPYGGHGYALARKKGRLSEWDKLLLMWLNELEDSTTNKI